MRLLFKSFFSILLLLSSVSYSQEFHKIINLPYDNSANAMLVTRNGYVILAGSSFESVDSSGVISKWDTAGNLIWVKKISVTLKSLLLKNVYESFDGNYILIGDYLEAGIPDAAIVIKTDTSGNIIWNKIFGQSYSNEFSKAVMTIDSGIVLLSMTDQKHPRLTKIDKYGSFQWMKSYSTDSSTNFGAQFNVTSLNTGELLLTAWISCSIFCDYILLIKTDSIGNLIWAKDTQQHATGGEYRLVQSGNNYYMVFVSAWTNIIRLDTSGSLLANSILDFNFWTPGPGVMAATADSSGGLYFTGFLGDTTYAYIAHADTNCYVDLYRSFKISNTWEQGNDLFLYPSGEFFICGTSMGPVTNMSDVLLIKQSLTQPSCNAFDITPIPHSWTIYKYNVNLNVDTATDFGFSDSIQIATITSGYIFDFCLQSTFSEDLLVNIPDIYPNPVVDYLHLDNIQNETTITIYNSVYQKVFSIISKGENVIADLNHLVPGFYFLSIQNSQGKFIMKKLLLNNH